MDTNPPQGQTQKRSCCPNGAWEETSEPTAAAAGATSAAFAVIEIITSDWEKYQEEGRAESWLSHRDVQEIKILLHFIFM